MAKHNAVFGTLSGKIGNIVFFRRRGRQVERVLVPYPSDPRTLAQGVIRARFANNKNLWRLLLPHVGNAWRSVSRYGYGGNAFYKHNVGNMPTCSLAMSRDGNCFPNLGALTYGGLQVNIDVQQTSIPTHRYTTSLRAPGTTKTTVGFFASELLDNNPSLAAGDILHILGITYSCEGSQLTPTTSNHMPTVIVGAAIPLDVTDNTLLSSVAPNFRFAGASSEEIPPIDIFFDWPSPAVNYDNSVVGSALAVFLERPCKPFRSRFTRSFWVMSEDDRLRLRPLCFRGNLADAFGRTFSNV